jgi:hypothetical protein
MAASPVFIVFAAPFGCGIANDLLDAGGTLTAIAVTAAACLAVLSWIRYRPRDSRPVVPSPRLVKPLGPAGTTHTGS